MTNSSILSTWIVIMAMGSGYEDLNNIQCAARSIPTLFQIDVNVIDRVIMVTPNSTVSVDSVDDSGWLVNKAGDTLAALSLVSTTSYTAVLGDMLNNNIFIVNQSGVESTQDGVYTRAVAESLQALAD